MGVELSLLKWRQYFCTKGQNKLLTMQTILLIKQVRTQQSDEFFQILEKQLKMSLPCEYSHQNLPLQILFKLCQGNHETAGLEVNFSLEKFSFFSTFSKVERMAMFHELHRPSNRRSLCGLRHQSRIQAPLQQSHVLFELFTMEADF